MLCFVEVPSVKSFEKSFDPATKVTPFAFILVSLSNAVAPPSVFSPLGSPCTLMTLGHVTVCQTVLGAMCKRPRLKIPLSFDTGSFASSSHNHLTKLK